MWNISTGLAPPVNVGHDAFDCQTVDLANKV